MLVGAHMANGEIKEVDLTRFCMGNFRAAKLMAIHHDVSDIERIKAVRPDCEFLVRLPDFKLFETYQTPDEYAQDCLNHIRRLYPHVKVWQVDNEPQYYWTTKERGPWGYQYYMRRAMRLLREGAPSDVTLVCPPLSFDPKLWRYGPPNPTTWTLDDWFAAYSWIGAGQPLWRLFDKVGCNAYWQSERQLRDPSFGGGFRVVHEKSGGMPVVICEAGNSLAHKEPPPPLREIHDAMVIQYPIWLEWANTFEYVEASYTFILGGQGWLGFEITDRVAHAIGRAKV